MMRLWPTGTNWTAFNMVVEADQAIFPSHCSPTLVWAPSEIVICQWNKQLKSYTRKDGVPVGTPIDTNGLGQSA